MIARWTLLALTFLGTAGCERQPLAIEVFPLAVVEVRLPDGSPAHNALAGILGDLAFLVDSTDASGRLVPEDVFDVYFGPAVMSAVRHDTLVAAAPITVAPGIRTFVLVLARGGTVRGNVERKDQTTHEGIEVRLDDTVIRTVTAPSGDFALTVPSGTWTVEVSDPGHTGWFLALPMPVAGDTVVLPPVVLVPTSSATIAGSAAP